MTKSDEVELWCSLGVCACVCICLHLHVMHSLQDYSKGQITCFLFFFFFFFFFLNFTTIPHWPYKYRHTDQYLLGVLVKSACTRAMTAALVTDNWTADLTWEQRPTQRGPICFFTVNSRCRYLLPLQEYMQWNRRGINILFFLFWFFLFLLLNYVSPVLCFVSWDL